MSRGDSRTRLESAADSDSVCLPPSREATAAAAVSAMLVLWPLDKRRAAKLDRVLGDKSVVSKVVLSVSVFVTTGRRSARSGLLALAIAAAAAASAVALSWRSLATSCSSSSILFFKAPFSSSEDETVGWVAGAGAGTSGVATAVAAVSRVFLSSVSNSFARF